MLTVCRVQDSPYTNYRLLAMCGVFEDMIPSIRNPVTSTPYKIQDLNVLAVMKSVYERFNIDTRGLPIGSTWTYRSHRTKQVTLITNLSFPPVTPEVFTTDWVELMATRYYRGTYVSIPHLVDHSIPPGPCYGQGHIVEMCTLHRVQRIMADLGYFEISNLKRTICLSEETLEDFQDVVLGNS